jgi:nicotinamidase-related amidase
MAMDKRLVLPGRYYCRWPFEQPRGLQYEEQVLDPSETAFFLIDVYGTGYDDTDRKAPEYPSLFFKEMFHKERAIIRDRIRPCLDAARAVGLNIVYTTNYWSSMNWDASEFGLMCYRTETGWSGTLEETIGGESDYVAWSDIVRPQPRDFLVNKTMYDAFFETNMDTLLSNLGVKNLVCVGFTADICLLNTVIGAMYRNYRVIVLRDCTLGAEFEDTLEDMRMTWLGIRYIEAMVGFTVTSDEFLEACKALG